MKARFILLASAAALLFAAFLVWRYRAGDEPQSDDPAQNIRWLSVGTPEKQVDRAYSSLVASGAAAFPALIKGLENRTPADNRFQRAVVEISPDGSRHPYTPTVGNVCFDILQLQIEGEWPKRMAAYYVVTPEWIREHASAGLPELRDLAVDEALRRAKGQNDNQAVAFFEERLRDIRR